MPEEQDIRRKAELVIMGELKNFTNKTDAQLLELGMTRTEADALAALKILVSRGGSDILLTGITADPATDVITVAVAHGLAAGDRVRFTTTGVLPAPLSPDAIYYVSATGLTPTQLEVSATSGGSVVDITDAGSGAHLIWKISDTAADQEPPFALMEAQDSEELIADKAAKEGPDNTWRINMAAAYVTQIDDELPEDHSSNVRLLRKGLQGIRPGYEPDVKFQLHGLNILGLDDFEDEAKQARGSIYSLVIGCSG